MENNISHTAKMSILALISLMLSLSGFTFLPLIGSAGGIITGNLARKEILQAPLDYSGHGLAKAGVILGWIGLSLCVSILLVGMIVFAPVFR
jgi:hypothetical protein